jgi:outer membrane protein OmpA-like peptidoglycan-associated protein
MTIALSGHTDNDGNAKANLKLSDDRAKAVVDYLVKKGIAANRLSEKGYGDTMPVADNGSEAGKAQNRRTDVTIIKE